jgi:hypothetical protein
VIFGNNECFGVVRFLGLLLLQQLEIKLSPEVTGPTERKEGVVHINSELLTGETGSEVTTFP